MKSLILLAAALLLGGLSLAADDSKADAPKNDGKEKVAVQAETKEADAPKLYMFDINGSGKTVTVRPGDTIQIKLNFNPSAGDWSLNLDKLDEKILKSLDGRGRPTMFTMELRPNGIDGLWYFRALAPGKTEIEINHAATSRTFKLSVEVKGEPIRETKLTDADNGKILKVHVGETVVITLDSNITTGFRWTKAEDIDKNILKLEKFEYKDEDGQIGINDKTEIIYRALKPGKATVDLLYTSRLDPDSKSKKGVTVLINVLEKEK